MIGTHPANGIRPDARVVSVGMALSGSMVVLMEADYSGLRAGVS
jgi:hypothetical protein